jgi:hypothetical protein
MTLHMLSSDITEQLKELQQLRKRVREAELNFLRGKRGRGERGQGAPEMRFSTADDVRQRPRLVRHRWPGRVRRA